MEQNHSELSRRDFLVASGIALASLGFGTLGCSKQKKEKLFIGYSDSHAHLDSFPEEDLKRIIAQMKEKNVTLVMNVSINLLTSAEAIKIAQANDGIYAAVGIHPGEAIPLTAEVKKKLEELSGQEKVVAFGEVGLNYGNSTGSNEEQRELLLFQKSLANNLQIPLNIHCGTDAYKECADMLKGSSGNIHGFTGTMDDLNTWLDIGYYISLGKVRSASDAGSIGGMPQRQSMSEDVIRAIPADRLLTETDCMARVNSRWSQLGKSGGAPSGGQGGAPGGMPGGAPGGASAQEQSDGPVGVIKAVESIAKIRGVSAEEIATLATNNLKRLLKIN